VDNNLSWEEIARSADSYAPPSSEIEEVGLEHPPKLVNCALDELRPHPSYVRHGLSPSTAQLSALSALGEHSFREPIVITSNRLIVDGYARFELAQRQRRETVLCLEYELSEEDALHWLIQRHRPSQGQSAFNRALLALDLEPSLQETARMNQQWGGQNKGLSSLTKAQCVNVRSKIAVAAGISSGNVRKVKYIVSQARTPLKEAVRTDEISINLAEKWSHEPDAKQHENLRLLRIERGIRRKARHLVAAEVARIAPSNRDEQVIKLSDLVTLVSRFATTISEGKKELDSVEVKLVDGPGRVIYITGELFRTLAPQQEVVIR